MVHRTRAKGVEDLMLWSVEGVEQIVVWSEEDG